MEDRIADDSDHLQHQGCLFLAFVIPIAYNDTWSRTLNTNTFYKKVKPEDKIFYRHGCGEWFLCPIPCLCALRLWAKSPKPLK